MAAHDDCSYGMLTNNSGFSSPRSSLCNALRSLIVNNIEYYRDDESTVGERFNRSFSQLLTHLDAIETEANEISRFASEYDFDPTLQGNGYRSFVSIIDSCVVRSIELCRSVCIGRGTLLFRKEHYVKEVEAYCSMFGCLMCSVRLLRTLRSSDQSDNLFPSSTDISGTDLLLEAGNIDVSSFYGRCLGFQFCESMMKPLKFIALAMASFSDAYFSTGGIVSRTTGSIFSCGKYAYYPEERAKRIVEVTHRASVDFCKAFWLLQENHFVQHVPGILYPQLVVNKVLRLPLELLKLPKHPIGTSYVEIPIPSSRIALAPVTCRLLSASVREGQLNEVELLGKRSVSVMPPSPFLVVHVHGGGFVAQSSKSHEVYLLDWATKLNVPILCIDYSLAPDASFPRPFEECFYAYAWAIHNLNRLGNGILINGDSERSFLGSLRGKTRTFSNMTRSSTGEKICLVGDSAGGNLILAVTLKAIEMGIRKPDSVFALYTPVLVDFVPSPSRLLCLMDPLLPFGFMMRCLKAYAGFSSSDHGRDTPRSESIGPASDSGSDVYGLNVNSINKGVGGLKLSPSESESESFEEVSASEVMDINPRTSLSSETVATVDLSVSSDSGIKGLNKIGLVVEKETNGKRDYVSDFMDWYILDIDEERHSAVLRSESMDSEENILFEMPADVPQRITDKMGSLTGRVFGGISGMLSSTSKNEREEPLTKSSGIFANRSLDDGGLKELIDEFRKLEVIQNHYLSPYLASNDLLRQMPPTRFLSSHLDPFLDDAIAFCKKLRSLDVRVGLDILDGLPHGFLNLVMVSKDAYDGSRMCIRRLREMLELPEDVLS